MRVATPCTRLDEKRDSILRKSLRHNHYRFFRQNSLVCAAERLRFQQAFSTDFYANGLSKSDFAAVGEGSRTGEKQKRDRDLS